MRYQLDGINCDFKRPAPGSFIIDGLIVVWENGRQGVGGRFLK